MKSLKIFGLSLIFTLTLAFTASAQLTGVKTIPGSYPTLAAAITDLNTQGVGLGGVTFNLGAPETAPLGGYVIGGTGSAVLGTASAANPIVFNGGGNTITAPTPQTAGNLNDGIFKLIGADWVTISGFTMLENPANTTTAAATNNMTEWGVALLYVTTTDGAQNDTIQNNTIDLDRTYQNTFGIYSNSTHSATAVTTSATATGAAGGNDNLKVYGNNITDVNNGIVHIGPTAAADQNPTADIGGTTAPTGNTITNFGTTGTFSSYANVSGTVNGILVRNTKNFNISRNTVTSSAGGVTVSGTINGIQIPASSNAPTGTLTQTINNNTISVRGGNIANVLDGINIPSTSVNATTTVSINNNDFNTFGHTVAGGTGAISFIIQGGNPLTQNMNSNTFTNISVNTTGTITFFSFAPSLISGASFSLSSNQIVTGFTRTGVGSTTVWSSNASSVAGSTQNQSNNNFSNITLTGASAFTGISNTDGGAPVKTINGNTFSNITTGAGTVVPMSVNFSGAGTNVNNNTITGITTGNSITALLIGSSNAATITVSGNIIDPINSAGTSVIGISVAGIGAVISKNKIYDLNGSVAGSVVTGIANVGTTTSSTITIVNNLIGNLTAPAATGSNAVIGINVSGTATTSTMNVYYNTVNLSNPTSGAGFGSSGIFALASSTATTTTLNLRNNIIVNTSIQNGAGLTVAYRRTAGTAGTLANYASTSNNNLFYAGTPSATNLIYSDGTSSAQTLALYKAGVFTAGTIAPRDSASVTENPPFLSTVGASANFLHINTTVATQIESGASPIAGITDDFDGNTRNVSTPDIGADEFAGILLDIIGPTISYTPLLNTSSTGNRTLNITVTDASGVPTAGIGLPVIYYRKNAGSYVNTQCVFVSGSNYTCSILAASLGGVALADVIDYYVAAQDNAGNVSVRPSTGASGFTANPPAVSTPPTTPDTYKIVGSVSGSFNVGTAETYTSLTNPGGLFEFINNNEVTGNITINITSDLAVESGTNGLNTFAGGFSVLIRPSGAPRTITSTATAAVLIKINGASNVTIDGSLTGGTDRSLSIISTGTTSPSAVVFGSVGANPITNDTLKNCIVVNGLNTSSAVVISDATTVGNAGLFSNITIQNNDIQKAFVGVFATGGTTPQGGSNLVYTQNTLNTSGANAIRNVGLYMQGVNGATVSSNTVGNFNSTNDESDVGIWLATGTINGTVSGNTVSPIAYTNGASGFNPIGMLISSNVASTNNNITGNTISNITGNGSSTGVRGLAVSGAATSDLTIQNNNISGVINNNTGTWGSFGMDLSGGNNFVVRNNFVSNVNQDMTGGAAFSPSFGVFGIRLNSGTGHQVYNNSVNLYGLQPGTPASSLLTAAFALVSTGSLNCDIRNNIFANNITGGTTSIAHVSAYLPSGGTSAMNLTWNNNSYYFGPSATTQGTGQAGTTAGTNFFTTLAALKTYSSTLSAPLTNDNASIAATTAVPYLTNTDLHITPSAPELGLGATIATVTTDYDIDPRPASGPDIGADELVQATPSLAAGTYYNVLLVGGNSLSGNVSVTNTLWLNGISDTTGANTLTLNCGAGFSGAGAASYVIGNFKRDFCGMGTYAFPVGTIGNGALRTGEADDTEGFPPEYSPASVLVNSGTFPSSLTINAVDQRLPGLGVTSSLSRYWNVTKAGGALNADMTFNYLDEDVYGNEPLYKVFKYDGAFTTQQPGTEDFMGNSFTATGVTTFSAWSAGVVAPTAATGNITGRVLTADGRPIANVRVIISGGQLPESISFYTGHLGYYNFEDLPVGQAYVITVKSRRFTFANPTKIIDLKDSITDADFIAEPQP
jgi:hypothetical protein